MEAIIQYITDELHDPQAATNLLNAIEAQISDLSKMPKRFALVSDKKLASRGLRLIPVKNYLIFYVVNEQTKTVSIVSVIYSKRDWINLLYLQ